MTWHCLRDRNIAIEVTPEMIDAGVSVICVGVTKTCEDMVRKIYLEMQRVKMEQTPGSGIAR